MGPLLAALAKADKDSRGKFLEALRDGIGANGLILALKSVSHESVEREKAQTKQLFDMMKELEDPRGGDLLVQYLATNPKPHWKTEAACASPRSATCAPCPSLAWRMREDPLKLYNNIDDPELRRDDNERVVSARMLADLAVMYPDQLADIREAGRGRGRLLADRQPAAARERPPLPRGSRRDGQALPDAQVVRPCRVPRSGRAASSTTTGRPPQSALRYLGWMKDPAELGAPREAAQPPSRQQSTRRWIR